MTVPSEPGTGPQHLRSPARRRPAPRKGRNRRIAVTLGILVILAGAGSATWAATSRGHTPSHSGRAALAPHVGPAVTTTTLPPTTPVPTTVDPGALPQTSAFPSSSDATFEANMQALWDGVEANAVSLATPSFFPESAYVQVKAISDPQEDYTSRLVGGFTADIAAAHALLGTDPAQASFVSVDINASYGHWVDPGTCYNSVGYYEMPNARMVYNLNGVIQSFGIASMISWRGEWYVVHLGAVVPTGSGGEVDDPETGPGTPAYSSTC